MPKEGPHHAEAKWRKFKVMGPCSSVRTASPLPQADHNRHWFTWSTPLRIPSVPAAAWLLCGHGQAPATVPLHTDDHPGKYISHFSER